MKRVFLCSAGLAALAALPANAQAPDAGPATVVVTAHASAADINQLPETVASIDVGQIDQTVNAVTVEDQLKFLPDILVRQRHVGDTQDPIATRTSGVGASARSLIYADDVLLSALIGNNNTSASPRWGMVAPGEIERIDVMYGPFSAAFPGNSIGEVVQITTRMPDKFEASGEIEGAWQDFNLYGTKADYPSGHGAVSVGDRWGPFSIRLDLNRLITRAQPLTFATATVPAATSASGAPVAGAFADANRLGQPVAVLGATALEDQTVDNAKLKLALDITPDVTAAYSLGYFANHDDAGVQTYLRDASAAPVYAGTVNSGGRAYALAASAFSASVYHLREQHYAQSLSAASHTGGVFDWEAVLSQYAFARDEQDSPSGVLPSAASGGAGLRTSLDGTGWITADLKGFWRPHGRDGMNQFSFGLHDDRFTLKSPKYNLADWVAGPRTSLSALSAGQTETLALWGQDKIALTRQVTLTVGARAEHWRAFGGVNYSASPALNVVQPGLHADTVSPKAVLAYQPDRDWRFSASFGQAYRFPTVSELYQAIATGPTLTSPNPNLKPEDALSGEVSAQRSWEHGKLRVSYFEEHVSNALISQTAPLVGGSNTLFSYVQNVPLTVARGVEVVGEEHDLGVEGLQLSGWLTYVDGRTISDPAFPAAQGKLLPQLPHLRGAVVATYTFGKVSFTLDGRYSDQAHGVIDDSDTYANTYQGFAAYFVADARVLVKLTPHWDWSVGVDNLMDRKYFLFHPFPQRTVTTALVWRY